MSALLFQGLVAMISTIAFALLFNVPARHYFCCGLAGALGWICYTGMVWQGYSPVFATFCGTVLLTVVSYGFSTIFRTPASVFLVSGIFPLVPGAGIYYTIYYFVIGENMQSLTKGIETIKIATIIALGIAFALPVSVAVMRQLSRLRRS